MSAPKDTNGFNTDIGVGIKRKDTNSELDEILKYLHEWGDDGVDRCDAIKGDNTNQGFTFVMDDCTCDVKDTKFALQSHMSKSLLAVIERARPENKSTDFSHIKTESQRIAFTSGGNSWNDAIEAYHQSLLREAGGVK